MNPDILKTIILEYLERIELPKLTHRDIPDFFTGSENHIHAIAGPRRSGKTYLLYQLIQDLLASGIDKLKTLFVDFEDYRLIGFQPSDIESLFTAFKQITGADPEYLFFDEIQHLPEWSRILRTLHNRKKFHIVITGSNSGLLTREISTELRGRYRDILVLPFSFPELLQLRGMENTEHITHSPRKGEFLRIFDEYLHNGGYPEVVQSSAFIRRKELLQDYFNSILYRDLIERFSVKSEYLLEQMLVYCMNTYSSLFSISAYGKMLKNQGIPGSKKTIASYIKYMEDPFFLIANEKFSYSPKKRMMNPRKIYLMDTGFTMLSADFSENKGRILENAVAIELFRRRVEMYYHREKYECDFILKDLTRPVQAIQVCWQLDEKNRKRELRGLQEAMNMYEIPEGLLLTYNEPEHPVEEINGFKIRVLPVWKWLLGDLEET